MTLIRVSLRRGSEYRGAVLKYTCTKVLFNKRVVKVYEVILCLTCGTHCKTSLCVMKLPAWHVDGQGLQSLYGVTMQSLLHGSKQGLTVSGRRLSGHLKVHHWHAQTHTKHWDLIDVWDQSLWTMFGVYLEAHNVPDLSIGYFCETVTVCVCLYWSSGWKWTLLFLMVLYWCHVILYFNSRLQFIRFKMKQMKCA